MSAAYASAEIDFGVIFDKSPNAYMVLDRDLRYVAANETYLRLTASSWDALRGRHLFAMFPHDPADPANASANLLRQSLARVLATRQADVISLIVYRVPTYQSDGRIVTEERYWSATHTPLLDAAGNVEFILQNTVDVTEAHRLRGAARDQPLRLETDVLDRARVVQRANETLDAERQHLRMLFEQAPGFVCSLRGPTHVVELANGAYYRLVGSREIVGIPIRDALPELAGQGFFELLDEVYRSGEAYVARGAPVRLRRTPDAPLDEVFLDFIYQPVVDAAGAVTGIFVQGSDVTQEKRLAAERLALLEREREARAHAEQANRLKDEFLATVSHELRTPLNAIAGWVSLWRSGGVSASRQQEVLAVLERNVRAQSQVVDDLLEIEQLVHGRIELARASVDVAAVASAAVESVRAAAAEKEVAVDLDVDSAQAALGDAARVRQIAAVLLSNAVKFSSRRGRISVRTSLSGAFVELSVTDTGAGIAASFLPHVFDPLRQADATSTRAQGGLGLGLSIAKRLVEAQGGTIEVASEGASRGARFTVRLPLADTSEPDPALEPARPRAGEEPAPRIRGKRVLVVDDDADARDLVQAILEREGAVVETAASARDAFDAFQRARPDVLISDIGMPGEDGDALLRRIRALPADAASVPAVALTGFARSADRTRALRAGFRAHVPKPIHAAELLVVLTSLLDADDG